MLCFCCVLFSKNARHGRNCQSGAVFSKKTWAPLTTKSKTGMSIANSQGGDQSAPRKGSLMLGGSALKEGLAGLGCGIVYGVTSAVVGQPLGMPMIVRSSVERGLQSMIVFFCHTCLKFTKCHTSQQIHGTANTKTYGFSMCGMSGSDAHTR